MPWWIGARTFVATIKGCISPRKSSLMKVNGMLRGLGMMSASKKSLSKYNIFMGHMAHNSIRGPFCIPLSATKLFPTPFTHLCLSFIFCTPCSQTVILEVSPSGGGGGGRWASVWIYTLVVADQVNSTILDWSLARPWICKNASQIKRYKAIFRAGVCLRSVAFPF